VNTICLAELASVKASVSKY